MNFCTNDFCLNEFNDNSIIFEYVTDWYIYHTHTFAAGQIFFEMFLQMSFYQLCALEKICTDLFYAIKQKVMKKTIMKLMKARPVRGLLYVGGHCPSIDTWINSSKLKLQMIAMAVVIRCSLFSLPPPASTWHDCVHDELGVVLHTNS